jgi:hypothetical protein
VRGFQGGNFSRWRSDGSHARHLLQRGLGDAFRFDENPAALQGIKRHSQCKWRRASARIAVTLYFLTGRQCRHRPRALRVGFPRTKQATAGLAKCDGAVSARVDGVLG